MYLRTTQRRNKDGSVVRYLALAENVRHPEKGYVEAKVVHSFGRADHLDRAALERLVASIQRVLADAGSGPVTREGASLGRIAIEASFELGVVHVAKALWAKLGIGEAIQAQLDEQQLTAPHAAALLAMVAQRLDRPDSKLACHERWLDRVWLPEARDLGLHQLYRALDVLALHGDAVEQAVFWRAVVCSSLTSTWSSMTAPPPGSSVTRRTSPARSGAGSPSSLCANAGTARKVGTTTRRW